MIRLQRVGKDGRIFALLKFRTMHSDIEGRAGAIWSQASDPRITRIGRFLRKIGIDEFPQFYNILKGDMSVVGPRAERPEFVKKLKELIPYYSERHFVRPGITGLSQLSYQQHAVPFEYVANKFMFDLYYISHCSFKLDIEIMFRTITTTLFGH